jgi:hypothetical protein
LGLIEAIAFLHQHQRPIQELKRGGETLKYIEVTWKDIELANRLAREVLGRSLDELPPQTRRLLGLLDELVQKECKRQGISRSDFRFSRKEARDFSSWGDTQLRVHLGRLIELEYLLVHRGRQGQSYEYELLYAGEVGAGPYLPGLIETSLAMGSSNEARTTTETSRGRDSHLAGGVRGSCGPDAGGVRPVQQTPEPHQNGSHLASIKSDAQTSHPGPRLNGTSYPKSPIDNTSEQPSTSRQAPL